MHLPNVPLIHQKKTEISVPFIQNNVHQYVQIITIQVISHFSFYSILNRNPRSALALPTRIARTIKINFSISDICSLKIELPLSTAKITERLAVTAIVSTVEKLRIQNIS